MAGMRCGSARRKQPHRQPCSSRQCRVPALPPHLYINPPLPELPSARPAAASAGTPRPTAGASSAAAGRPEGGWGRAVVSVPPRISDTFIMFVAARLTNHQRQPCVRTLLDPSPRRTCLQEGSAALPAAELVVFLQDFTQRDLHASVGEAFADFRGSVCGG